MILLPIGVKDAPAGRRPVASIAIAALTILVFVAQDRLGEDNAEGLERAGRAFERFWQAHPYLQPPLEIARHFVPAAPIAEAYAERRRRAEAGTLPPPHVLAREEERLAELLRSIVEQIQKSGSNRWAIVPARGTAQPGWISSMFLHADFWHLFGNLLFFAVAAPLVEGALGPVVFALFYLAGGVVAAIAHVLIDPASPIPLVGASGAVAACMGAAALRFARERINFFWWFAVWRGTYAIPAWVAGSAWILNELWSLDLRQAGGGVAVMAHVGGFAFGSVVALGLRSTGLERHLVAPIKDDGRLWRRDPGLRRAREALDAGDHPRAGEEWEGVLVRDPGNAEAHEGLLALAHDRGDAAAFHRHLEAIAQRAFADGRDGDVRRVIEGRTAALDPAAIRTALLVRLAALVEEDAPGTFGQLLAEIVRRDVPQSPKAAVQLGRALARSGRPGEARAQAAFALAREASEEVRENARRLVRALPLAAQFAGREEGRFTVLVEGGERLAFAPGELRELAAGVVASHTEEGVARANVIVLDLLVGRASGTIALRFFSHRLGLGALYPPGTDPRAALAHLIGLLASTPGLTTSPGPDALKALQLPRFADLAAFRQERDR